ncbi:hypothetical protein VD0004_g4691 [Verticillium dahliae]|uniref:NADP-dependent oxidoreductase domain-containing protein n=1 Tax=Verticillium dahliae TaxID=27337 RepID=A0A444S8A1_VERDA|nr:hypothetical protein VD0004_g4691 [Verticillium dahliae]PNH62875.1 hypothetical protein VD0001_g9322 [Verticillium dahliae]RXG49629.1 hypothetical protein VDGE_06756 [Verticillium dahliae]
MSSSRKPVVTIGSDGPTIPAMGFGAMGLSYGYGAGGSDEERFKVLDRAWEIGCVNWDTAISYGDQLRRQRGPDRLRRLGVESIDLYYMHRANPSVAIEKTVQAMKELHQAGKIKYLGLSEVSSVTLRRAHAVHPIAAVQIEYNPWTLDIEGPSGTNLLDTCKELGVAVVAYSPLGRGILTGKYRSKNDFEPGDVRHYLERYQDENFRKNLVLVDKFEQVAKRKGCTLGQLVLAWLVAQWDKVIVIPGTKKIKYLEENFDSGKVEITSEEERELRELVSSSGISGSRNPFFGQFVDTVSL